MRLAGMSLARRRADGRYEITEAGLLGHARVVLRRPTPVP
jgi:hypothetical protein